MKQAELPARVLIATGNAGKQREFATLLRPLGIALTTLDEIAHIDPPEETGSTFEENAELKASYYSKRSGEWTIADDSGLEVEALDGRPGVHSSRYGGMDTPYSTKIKLLLRELTGTPGDRRLARFVSVIVLADPSGKIRLTARGTCTGLIAEYPRGNNGFGYDPIFVPDGMDLTFGEMSDQEKHELSHRGIASIQFIRKMSDFTGV